VEWAETSIIPALSLAFQFAALDLVKEGEREEGRE
jgi:hypothetical protein